MGVSYHSSLAGDSAQPVNADRKVYVIMCVYRPNIMLLRGQLNSILSQEYSNFELIVVFDGSSGQAESVIKEYRDPRIIGSFEDRHLGVYLNYCRGLRLALSRSCSSEDYFAYCDQDDVWRKDKLRLQVEFLEQNPSVTLVHSDARVVNKQGLIIGKSMFEHEGRSRRSSLHELILTNNVTGMTAVFRKCVATFVLACPKQNGVLFYHDLWTALIAAATGKVELIEETLVDYIQHDGNVIGSGKKSSGYIDGYKWKKPGTYVNRCIRQYLIRYYLYSSLVNAGVLELEDGKARVDAFLARIYGAGCYGLELFLWVVMLITKYEHVHFRQGIRIAVGKAAILVEWLIMPGGYGSGKSFGDALNEKCNEVLDM